MTLGKMQVKLVGQDGNIFNLVGITSKEMRRHGLKEQVEEMQKRVMSSGSYEEALSIIGEYVEIV